MNQVLGPPAIHMGTWRHSGFLASTWSNLDFCGHWRLTVGGTSLFTSVSVALSFKEVKIN